jgi:hypothetical protein
VGVRQDAAVLGNGIAQRIMMMPPNWPAAQSGAFCLRGLGTNWCWDELAFRRPTPRAPAVACREESPEQSSKSSRGSFLSNVRND